MNKLYEFYFEQHEKVLIVCAGTFVVFFTWGLVAMFALGIPEETIYLQSAIGIPCLIVSAVLAWANAAQVKRLEVKAAGLAPPSQVHVPWKKALAACSVILVLVFLSTNPPNPVNNLAEEYNRSGKIDIALVPSIMAHAQQAGVLTNVRTLDSIQQHIARTSMSNRDNLAAALALLNYSSFVREKLGLAKVRSETCQAIVGIPKDHIGIAVDGGQVDGCRLTLDGLSLSNFTVKNALVRYDGGPVELRNVTFINCVFELSQNDKPSSKTGEFAKQLIAKQVGDRPMFNLTLG